MKERTQFSLRRSLSVLLVLCLLVTMAIPMCVSASSVKTDTGKEKAKEAMNGVVRILGLNEDGSGGTGSGFGIGKVGKPTRYFVTNWHVVAKMDSQGNSIGLVDYVYIIIDDNAVVDGWITTDTNVAVRARVLGNPVEYPDFAILEAEVEVPNRVALPLTRIQEMEPMDEVFALGYPGTADDLRGDSNIDGSIAKMNVTAGNINQISTIEMAGGLTYLIHSCEINHGNSGGPLVNRYGAVVGINTYGIAMQDGGLTSNYSLTVPIDYVIDELDRLGVPYEINEVSNPVPGWVLPTVIGVVVLAVVVVILLVMMNVQKKKDLQQAQIMQAQLAQMEYQAQQMGEQNRQIQNQARQLSQMGSAVEQAQQRAMEAERNAAELAQRAAADAAQRAAKQAAAAAAQAAVKNAAASQRPAVGNASAFRLVGIRGAYAGKRYAIPERICIGADPAKNHLTFAKGTQGISRRHCELRVQNGALYIIDVGSSYGTYVNGRKLVPNQPVQLNVGDVFCLASDQITFKIDRSSRA